ncbi:HAD-IIA family hydrolase [Rugosimonospora africana]|uniref:Acid sugar phosphatase n=1 Tax=Rugosimonospora africana TaxID=556532 RepID=A0A8J3R327_9ACTN|nr:HAD-IIA family hydrolase [Rugosimonospora africana]GIH19251.1 acid sugar phosphatase [Rugosimonospora africana]
MSGQARVVDGYDLIIFDLDGVVYLGTEPVPGAADAINRLHEEHRALAYATNNAGRLPQDVAALLVSLGIPASADEVITSPQAAARLLAERLPAGSRVLIVGADALRAEIAGAGLEPVDTAEDAPAAVVQGYGPDVGWRMLAEASVAIRAGALWVATNADRTLPSPRGPLPGNGSLVAALVTALDRAPDAIVGKPEPALFNQAAKRIGAQRPVVVGDRLDTDIEGAVRAGMDSVLVLTGVSTAQDLLAAPAHQRPTFVAFDLTGLFTVDSSSDESGSARLTPRGDPDQSASGWRVSREGDALELAGEGTPVEALRLLAAHSWDGGPPDAVMAAGSAAEEALRVLRLTG